MADDAEGWAAVAGVAPRPRFRWESRCSDLYAPRASLSLELLQVLELVDCISDALGEEEGEA